MRCGLVTLVGRPNVGKSTLVNRLVGRKVTITSTRPQTTRSIVRGVVNDDSGQWQIVLVDTPGLHRPRNQLGARLNRLVHGSLAESDVVGFLVDATQAIGRGDRLIARRLQEAGRPVVLVLTKLDRADQEQALAQLGEAAAWDFAAYVPISAVTGLGIDSLLRELVARLPEAPALFPPGMDTDQPERFLIAEIIREKFLDRLREELPHSLHVDLGEMEETDEVLHIEAELLVERQSQKGIVIGKRGAMLEAAGSEARAELESLFGTRVHLRLHVSVEPDWQRRPQSLDRLGFGER